MCGAWTTIEEPSRHCIGFLREEREKEDRGRTIDRDHQERLERPGNIMGEGSGAGNGHSRVEKMRCPMYINVQDGLRSKVILSNNNNFIHNVRILQIPEFTCCAKCA